MFAQKYSLSLTAAVLLTVSSLVGAQYTATYLPSNAPDKTEKDQTGTNKCGTTASQTSMCQNAYINSVDDFCVWAPPNPGKMSTIGDTEQIEVAWCTKDGYGTRLIPEGTLLGVHFVQTPDYVQITGNGDFTKMNVPKGDAGGELDPHGADGAGNPHGGLVFSTAFGALQQVHEWTNYMSETEFCFRACKDGNTTKAKALCQHIYDVMGCGWVMPARYDNGVFESCKGDSGDPMGVYGTSTFHQGDPVTPSAHSPPAVSQCTTIPTIGGGTATPGTVTTAPPSSVTGTSSVSGTGSNNSTTPVSSGTNTRTTSPLSSSGAPSTTGSVSNPTTISSRPTGTVPTSSVSSPTSTNGAVSDRVQGWAGIMVIFSAVSFFFF